MTNKEKGILYISLAAILLIIILVSANSKHEKIKEKAKIEVIEKPLLPKGKYSARVKLKNDSYRFHSKAAISGGVDVINDFNEIQAYLNSGKLVKIENKQGYVINSLTHSKAVLNKKSAKILEQIGQQFYADTDGQSYFTVTSLTRSNESQKILRKRNLNATKNISTHCYGASFDISYMRFNGVKEWNDPLKVKLEFILAKLQNEGKIYVLREKRSACYHITTK